MSGCGGAERPGRAQAAPPPPASFAQARPLTPRIVHRTRPRPRGRFLIAHVHRSTQAYARPGGPALRRLGRRTQFGSRRVVAVVKRRAGWLGVTVPERPNHRLAWIRESRVSLYGTDVSIVVDRSARRLQVRRGRRVLRTVAIAVGRDGTPTPLGRYAVTDKLLPGRGSVYGCCAVALSAHQKQLLPGWPGGDRVAIHGTTQTHSIGQAVSLGCMRASEHDMRALLRRVPLGAPVFVRA